MHGLYTVREVLPESHRACTIPAARPPQHTDAIPPRKGIRLVSDSDKLDHSPLIRQHGIEDRFRTAFAVAPVGMAIMDADGMLRNVNLSLCEALGFAEVELVGTHFFDLLHPEDRGALSVQPGSADAARWSVFSIEVRLLNRSRQALSCVLSVTPVREQNGAPEFLLVQVQDATVAKGAERRLALYAAELERSNQELEQFAYVVSHDLQAPLRTLRGYTQLLLEEYGRKLDEQGQRWAAYVLSSADRMHVLISDLLKVARVQAHSSPVTSADLGPIVARAWERIAYVYANESLEFVCDAMPTIPVDEIQIEQVFQNLFDNALKYRHPDIPPRVEVRAAREGDDWHISVGDNGIGLDMSQADRIFDIFQRLHPDHAYDGTGIGLAVCRKIVERHQGRIWVESAPNAGATFHFTIPVSTGSAV